MRRKNPRARLGLGLAVLLTASTPAGADPANDELRAQLELLIEQNRQIRQELDALKDEVRGARDEAEAAQARAARAEARAAASEEPAGAGTAGPGILSQQVGRANFQVLDISLDVITSFGWSSAENGELRQLQGGDHDPRRRGFNLQNVELGFQGAVDPYFTADAYLVYFLDPEGESRFEIEEAFATTMVLPFGLEQQGLQIEAGQFYTEYGRLNPFHPHAWDWQDQPIVNTRLFGPDGLRNPGLRIGWLTPLPWYSELHFGSQSAQGETAVSFDASDEVFDEGGIGGRPFASAGTQSLADLIYLARWVNGGDLSDEWSAQWGITGLFGPNATGSDGRTTIAGTDLVLKWRPLDMNRGAPSLTWQTEFSYRWYDADAFVGPTPPLSLPGELLRDWGLYTQLVWGFARNWDVGLRYEYAGGSGDDVALNDTGTAFERVSRNDDPFRATRHRVSPLLTFRPTEFSRLRLQYNYDRAVNLADPNVHTGWLGLEFLIGSHPAHAY